MIRKGRMFPYLALNFFMICVGVVQFLVECQRLKLFKIDLRP